MATRKKASPKSDVLTERLSPVQNMGIDVIHTDVEAVLNTPQGKRLIRWILTHTHTFGSIYTADANTTAFGLGERNVGLRLIALMNEISPSLYPRLLLDAANQETQEREVQYAQVPDDDDYA